MTQNMDFCHFLWAITLLNLCLFKIIREKSACFLFPEQSLLVVVLFVVCPLITDHLRTSNAGLSCICIVRPVWRVLRSPARSSWFANTGWVELFLLFCYFHHTVSKFECNLCVFVHTHADMLVSQYIQELKSQQMLTCCGAALALGCLPKFMINGKLKQVYFENMHIYFIAIIHICTSCWYKGVCIILCDRSWKAFSSYALIDRRVVSQRQGEMLSKQWLSEYPYLYMIYISAPSLTCLLHLPFCSCNVGQ